jgi:hypothetical protein
MRIGDKVLYIYNNQFEGGNGGLLNGAVGKLDKGMQNHTGCMHFEWTAKNGDQFGWWVPPNHVRKIKPSDLS